MGLAGEHLFYFFGGERVFVELNRVDSFVRSTRQGLSLKRIQTNGLFDQNLIVIFMTVDMSGEGDCERLEQASFSLSFFMAHSEAGRRCTVQSITPPRRGV
jgi:hypothetical protein